MFFATSFIVASLVEVGFVNYLNNKETKDKKIKPTDIDDQMQQKEIFTGRNVHIFSRLFFPAAYVVFNIAYWMTYLQ